MLNWNREFCVGGNLTVSCIAKRDVTLFRGLNDSVPGVKKVCKLTITSVTITELRDLC